MNKVEKELDQLIKAYKDYTYNSENPIVVLESFICDLEEIKEMVKLKQPNVQELIEKYKKRQLWLENTEAEEFYVNNSKEGLQREKDQWLNWTKDVIKELESLQPQEVKTECEYCSGEENLYEEFYEEAYICENEIIIRDEERSTCLPYTVAKFKINYCPMCGTKLK